VSATSQPVAAEEPRSIGQRLDRATYKALHEAARRRTRNHPDAGDAVQECAVRLLQQEADGRGWKPPPPPTFWEHALATLCGVFKDVRRGWKRLQRRKDGAAAIAATEGPHTGAAMDEEERRQELEWLLDELDRHYADRAEDHLPREVLKHTRAGVEGRKALADVIGCREADITNATKRIVRLAEQLRGAEAGRAGQPQ
jgi:DNA-directed RNA polymerase specialized sigma24 family protein